VHSSFFNASYAVFGLNCSNWWNTDWSYRKLITFNSNQIVEGLTNFPVLISTNDDNLKDHAQADGDDITFMDDNKGDGFLVDKKRRIIIPTEHVCALDIPEAKNLPKGEKKIINAINLKISKGPEYADGKILVVFFDGAGKFYRNKIRQAIYGKHNFEAVFCVGLLESGEEGYSYARFSFPNMII